MVDLRRRRRESLFISLFISSFFEAGADLDASRSFLSGNSRSPSRSRSSELVSFTSPSTMLSSDSSSSAERTFSVPTSSTSPPTSSDSASSARLPALLEPRWDTRSRLWDEPLRLERPPRRESFSLACLRHVFRSSADSSVFFSLSALRVLDELLAATQNGHQQQAETDAALRERLAYYFLEWVRMYQLSPSAEQAFVAIVTNLQAQGILKGEEVTFLFFRVCAETAIEGYSKSKTSDPVGALVPLDALSKLFVLLLKNYGDPNGAEADESKVRYLNKILSIVVLVLVQSHEQLGHDFDQRPFFRFFSSILNDLHHIEPSIPTAYLGCLRAFR